MDNFFDYFIMHMVILGYGEGLMCSVFILENRGKYKVYLCIDYQMYDHNIR